ncbi:MAG: disulfide bond formation protein B [Alphaproteobacteria bacterium]|nr:disulfide bond formation protein B [Alphaproteobacteria bacterium]MDE2336598.1 disulfide bond formation protein B [Alphaproteobacteria bacterium]
MNRLAAYLRPHRHLALAVAFTSTAMLAAAFIAQYGFGLLPCELCLLQRWPYALNILLGAAAFIATFRHPRLAALLIALAAASFFADAAIAGYHVGVERHWWAGPSSCTGSFLSPDMSVAQLQKFLTHRNIVPCDKIGWTLFGVTMAGYNCAAAFALGVFTVYLLKKDHAAQA